MNTFTLEGWCKDDHAKRALPIERIHFKINDEYHLLLEQAEEELQENHNPEKYVPIDISTMELSTSNDCGSLKDCKIRVYIRNDDQRGQFHLVGHRELDNCLVYSNAVMIDQLG
ncbi:hypothetical protein [Parendozoicomonas sp. Alg238-R29]|uniref:hypothetical protein n=1 Tax=Parendozoicomonas sp. Alg238-R29 TaxID=2993446 RepID=UPI00248D3DAA|nr:hypothetical protein [Parendozoicomonas sp. Alg238-R29]